MKHTRIDLAGQRFGRLVVAAFSHTKSGRAMWLCKCDCGNDSIVSGKLLRCDHTKSCGCLGLELRVAATKKHGLSHKKDKTYNCWKDMRKRCNNPASMYYYRYGGRGIKVCPEWDVFQNFLADMGPCPDGYSIERLDIEKGYEPGNCKWIPLNRQQRNTSKSRRVTAFGKTQLVVEWAEEYGLSAGTLSARINKLGWPAERAISTPARPTRRLAV
jgi:hypothetical protein